MNTPPNPSREIRNEVSPPLNGFEDLAAEEASRPLPVRKAFPWVNLLLFLITIYTTLLAGAAQMGVNAFSNPRNLIFGIPFSFTLMAILLTHEMGHYLASRYHRVQATLPYFLPAPPFFIIGTFGAFIRMTSPITNKKALLDIGAAGPIAGFVITLPALFYGLSLSPVMDISQLSGFKLGDPLVFRFISYLIFGPIPDNYGIILHPVAYAAWFGLFVTALNLIPIGQLDGGHITYAILGRHHRRFSLGMVPLLLAMGFFAWPGWYLWAVIPLIFGIAHPPLIDPDTPLDRRRILIGWVSLAVLVLCFTPVPISL